jgi:adenylate kinase
MGSPRSGNSRYHRHQYPDANHRPSLPAAFPPGIIGITGTPGTGKKTIAPLVASMLGLAPPLSLSSLTATEEVEPRTLRKRLLKAVEPKVATVVVGHLLPDVVAAREVTMVAVLRCDPSRLRERLVARDYQSEKLRQNIEAELIGVVLDSCVRRFGHAVHEYNTTSKPPASIAHAIARDCKRIVSSHQGSSDNKHNRSSPSGRANRAPRWIDWTLDYGSPTRLTSLLTGRTDLAGST